MLVHNKGDLVRHIGVRLIPGVNRIFLEDDKNAFNDALKHPLNKFLVDEGEIIVTTDEDGQTADSVSKLNARKAVELINDTFELSVLEAFRKEEKANSNRKTVLDAISDRIESIKNPPEDQRVKEE